MAENSAAGFATLTFTAADGDGSVRLDVRLFDRDALAAAGGDGPVSTALFRLHPDRRTGSVERVDDASAV